MTSKYFLPFCKLPFYSVDCFPCCEVLKLDVVPFVYFGLCFGDHIQEIISGHNDMPGFSRWTVRRLAEACQPQTEAETCWSLNPCRPFHALQIPSSRQKLRRASAPPREAHRATAWSAGWLTLHLRQRRLLLRHGPEDTLASFYRLGQWLKWAPIISSGFLGVVICQVQQVTYRSPLTLFLMIKPMFLGDRKLGKSRRALRKQIIGALL